MFLHRRSAHLRRPGGAANLARTFALLPLLIWLVLLLSLWLTSDPDAKWNAVAISESAVYTADSENSAPRLAKPLPSGTELSVIQQRERWIEVLLPDGRAGWVLAATIDLLLYSVTNWLTRRCSSFAKVASSSPAIRVC